MYAPRSARSPSEKLERLLGRPSAAGRSVLDVPVVLEVKVGAISLLTAVDVTAGESSGTWSLVVLGGKVGSGGGQDPLLGGLRALHRLQTFFLPQTMFTWLRQDLVGHFQSSSGNSIQGAKPPRVAVPGGVGLTLVLMTFLGGPVPPFGPILPPRPAGGSPRRPTSLEAAFGAALALRGGFLTGAFGIGSGSGSSSSPSP